MYVDIQISQLLSEIQCEMCLHLNHFQLDAHIVKFRTNWINLLCYAAQ
uniref:Uncharacterized protein n=1 Tax=Lepeophtheirus salmonis TaxID=72036 RepID=A0A0K2TAQ2_LEPSM